MLRLSSCVLMLMAVLALNARPAFPQDATPAKAAVPTTAAQDTALKLIKDIYGTQYADTTPAGKKKLAQDLLAEGQKNQDDAPGRFVLLREARDLAVQAGAAAIAFDAIDQLDQSFAIDAAAMKVGVVTALAPKASGADASALANAGVALMDSLLLADDYAAVAKLVPPVSAAINRVHDDESKARLKAIQATVAEYEHAKPAFDKLKTDPADPAANLAAGKFYCFFKGDWAKGLPPLAKGADAKLAALAQLESANPTEPDKLKQLGDAWWDWSESQPAAARNAARIHAGESYQKAQPNLAGLAKVAVDKRLEQIARLAVAEERPAATPPVPQIATASWSAPDQPNGIKWVRHGDSQYTPVERGGKDAVLSSKYYYFDVDDKFAFNLPKGADERDFVRLLLWDEKPTAVKVEYDGYSPPDDSDQARRWQPTGFIALSGSGQWVEKIVELRSPRLGGGLHLKTDIRIDTNDPVPALGRITLERMKLRPVAQRTIQAGSVVDLMPLIDVEHESVGGQWKKDGAILTCMPDQVALLALPILAHGDYLLEMRFTRVTGQEAVCAIIAVGGNVAQVGIDGWRSSFSGLGLIDGHDANLTPLPRAAESWSMGPRRSWRSRSPWRARTPRSEQTWTAGPWCSGPARLTS
jgi:hypothetical protein